MAHAGDMIRYWRRQATVLIAASKDDGTSQEQRDLSIGVAKGLRFAARQLAKAQRDGHVKDGELGPPPIKPDKERGE